MVSIVKWIFGIPFLKSQYNPQMDFVSDFSIVIPFVVILYTIRIFIVQLFTKLGKIIATYTVNEEYVKDPENKKRFWIFALEGYKLLTHLLFTLYAYLSFHNDRWWFDDYEYIFSKDLVFTPNMKRWSLMEIAYHIVGSAVLFIEESRTQDLIAMNLHHVSVIFLSVGGYFSCPEMALLCTVVHDISDVALSFLKMCDKMKISSLTLINAAINLASWIYFRLYIFPFRLVHSVIFIGWKKYNYISAKILSVFLSILVCLHVFWLFLILKSYQRFFKGLKKGEHSDNCDTQEFEAKVHEKKKKDEIKMS